MSTPDSSMDLAKMKIDMSGYSPVIQKRLRAQSPGVSLGRFPSKNRDFWLTEGNRAGFGIRGSHPESRFLTDQGQSSRFRDSRFPIRNRDF